MRAHRNPPDYGALIKAIVSAFEETLHAKPAGIQIAEPACAGAGTRRTDFRRTPLATVVLNVD